MSRLIGLAILLFVGVVGWRIGDGLSADALGMVLGMWMALLFMVPFTFFVVAAFKRTEPPTPPRYHYQGDIQPPAPAQVTNIHHEHNHVHFHQAQAPSVAGATQRKIATHG